MTKQPDAAYTNFATDVLRGGHLDELSIKGLRAVTYGDVTIMYVDHFTGPTTFYVDEGNGYACFQRNGVLTPYGENNVSRYHAWTANDT